MPISDPTDLSSCVLWLQKTTASRHTTIAGGTPVAADSDPIGLWMDASGQDNHIAAAANNSTRPVYDADTGGTLFDGNDDVLFRTSSLGLYAGGEASIFLALRANPAVNAALVGESSVADSLPLYLPMRSSPTTAARAHSFIRSEVGGGGTHLLDAELATASVWDNTDRVVGIVDTGSSVTLWIDGVEQAAVPYTRSGTLTPNRFALGAAVRVVISNWFAALIYEVAIHARPLDDTEAADLSAYLANALPPSAGGGGFSPLAGPLASRLLRGRMG